MLNAIFGRAIFGKILFGYGAPVPPPVLLSAPFDRTFIVPQDGLPWQGKKTPEELINFSFNWNAEIGNDLIASSVWELESTDISTMLSAIDATTTIATILISGGVANNVYNVTNKITTQSGLQLDATFRLFVNSYNL